MKKRANIEGKAYVQTLGEGEESRHRVEFKVGIRRSVGGGLSSAHLTVLTRLFSLWIRGVLALPLRLEGAEALRFRFEQLGRIAFDHGISLEALSAPLRRIRREHRGRGGRSRTNRATSRLYAA